MLASIYIRKADEQKWKLLKNKTEIISQAINNNYTSPTPVKSTEIATKTDSLALERRGKSEINELFDYWQEQVGIPVSAKIKQNRYAANNLLKKHGLDKVKQLINGVAQAQSEDYAPRIANFIQLQAKFDELILWGRKKTKPRGVKV